MRGVPVRPGGRLIDPLLDRTDVVLGAALIAGEREMTLVLAVVVVLTYVWIVKSRGEDAPWMLWVFLTAVAALGRPSASSPVTRRPCGMPAGGSHDRLRAAGGTTGHVGLARCRCIAKRQSCEVARGPGRDGSVGGAAAAPVGGTTVATCW